MTTLEHDAQGALITPFAHAVNAQAEKLAAEHGKTPAECYAESFAVVAQAQPWLAAQHERLMSGQGLTLTERQALADLEQREAADAYAAATARSNAGVSYNDLVQRVLAEEFGGDTTKRGEAMLIVHRRWRAVAAEHVDSLADSILRTARRE